MENGGGGGFKFGILNPPHIIQFHNISTIKVSEFWGDNHRQTHSSHSHLTDLYLLRVVVVGRSNMIPASVSEER
jgi:hypothetical protein